MSSVADVETFDNTSGPEREALGPLPVRPGGKTPPPSLVDPQRWSLPTPLEFCLMRQAANATIAITTPYPGRTLPSRFDPNAELSMQVLTRTAKTKAHPATLTHPFIMGKLPRGHSRNLGPVDRCYRNLLVGR